MKKLMVALGLACSMGTAWAEPECPAVRDIKSTTMDFIFAWEADGMYSLNPDMTYAALGHFHGQDQNWYVLDGGFKGETTIPEALKRAQDFLQNADEPILMHDQDRSNIWACIYHFNPEGTGDGIAKVIVAANGSVEDLKGFVQHKIK